MFTGEINEAIDSDSTATLLTHIIEHVKQAGQIALAEQRAAHGAERSYKGDESVVTAADRRVEDFLVKHLTALDADANIVTEESSHPFDAQQDRTFAIDPIDGSDVYSQGMPGWCVSVGLLDRELEPQAGVVFAPRLDLLIVAHVGRGVQLNGSPLPRRGRTEPISIRSNLMVTSRIHKVLDLSGYVGKIRGIGSAALHLCFPLIYPPVIGALEGPGIHVWDMVAAHAANRAQGEDLRYLSGGRIDYGPMVNGTPGADVVVAAPRRVRPRLRAMLRRLPLGR